MEACPAGVFLIFSVWRHAQFHILLFYQEIKLMEKLNHPYVIRMLETIDSPKRVHIVMEYAGG